MVSRSNSFMSGCSFTASADRFDLIAIPLLGEKELTASGVIQLDRIPCDQCVEHCLTAPSAVDVSRNTLRTQDSPKPLRLLLPAAERPRNLDGDVRVGQVDREIRDLADDQSRNLPRLESFVERVALLLRRLARDDGGEKRLRHQLELIE